MKNPFRRKVLIQGKEVRPQKGSCPRCGAKERQWCKSSCTILDPANMARE